MVTLAEKALVQRQAFSFVLGFLGEHFSFAPGFVDVVRMGNNSFSSSTKASSGDTKAIINMSSNSDRAWRCGQLGEDYPREQAKGAEGQQKVPRCAKVNCFSPSSFFYIFSRFCDFVTGSSQELYELFADLKKMFHQTGYILQQVHYKSL